MTTKKIISLLFSTKEDRDVLKEILRSNESALKMTIKILQFIGPRMDAEIFDVIPSWNFQGYRWFYLEFEEQYCKYILTADKRTVSVRTMKKLIEG